MALLFLVGLSIANRFNVPASEANKIALMVVAFGMPLGPILAIRLAQSLAPTGPAPSPTPPALPAKAERLGTSKAERVRTSKS
jgi:hypothetical protein